MRLTLNKTDWSPLASSVLTGLKFTGFSACGILSTYLIANSIPLMPDQFAIIAPLLGAGTKALFSYIANKWFK